MTHPAVLAQLRRSEDLLRRAYDLIVEETEVLSPDAKKLLAKIDRCLARGEKL